MKVGKVNDYPIHPVESKFRARETRVILPGHVYEKDDTLIIKTSFIPQ